MSERIYRQLLKLYPKSFRAVYGDAMVQHFRDQFRDARNSGGLLAMSRFWISTLFDTLVASTRERLSRDRRPNESVVEPFARRLPSFGFLFVAFFLPLMTAVVVNLVTQPRTFVAMSRVLVQPRGEETGAVSVKIAGYDPYFMQTQMEIIKSDAVLRNVVYQLGLARSMAAAYDIKTEFSASDAVEMLRRQLQLSQSRNTSLLEIRVFSASSSQAEAIANAIPMQYASIAPHARMSIIDPARAPLRPVRPNVPLVLISGFLASASLSIVASFLLRFLLRRSFTRTLHPSAA